MVDWSPDCIKTRVKFIIADEFGDYGELEKKINSFIRTTSQIRKVVDIKLDGNVAMVIYEVYSVTQNS